MSNKLVEIAKILPEEDSSSSRKRLQLIILAIGSVIVARLLGPENYGLLSLSLVVPSIFKYVRNKLKEIGCCTLSYIVLSKEDRKLLIDTRKLLEELLETLDIISSPEELKALEESEKEMREGKLTSLDDLAHEIEEEKVQS